MLRLPPRERLRLITPEPACQDHEQIYQIVHSKRCSVGNFGSPSWNNSPNGSCCLWFPTTRYLQSSWRIRTSTRYSGFRSSWDNAILHATAGLVDASDLQLCWLPPTLHCRHVRADPRQKGIRWTPLFSGKANYAVWLKLAYNFWEPGSKSM